MTDNKIKPIIKTKVNKLEARCHKCHETKPLDRFYSSRRTGHTDHYRCKSCYKREFRQLLREGVLEVPLPAQVV
jgi:hypothetical protein